MERLSNDRRPSGLTGNALRMWGMFLLAASIAGRSIIQNRIFGIGNVTGEELLAIMDQDPRTMYLAAIALVLQAGEACAVGVYAFLLTEGMRYTSDFKRYFLRILSVAVISEIPYNFAVYGEWLNLSSRNPVFGLVLTMVMLWFYKRYPGFTVNNVIFKLAATVGALLWSSILSVNSGVCVVIISAALWAFQKKPQLRVFAGAMAAILCSVISPFYMIAPVAFLLLHFYNGEKGETNPTVNYLSYPVLLVVIALVGMFAFK